MTTRRVSATIDQRLADARPGWREPMLAVLTEKRFSDENWLFERKLDGVRVIAARDGDELRLWSRNQKPVGANYPEIAEALSAAPGDRFVVDGEIVAFSGTQTSFATLQGRLGLTDRRRIAATGIRVYYYLFDLLHWKDTDVRPLPLRQRKQLLGKAFDFTDPLRFATHRNTDGLRFYEEACARGWEGLIAKRADSPYRGGRRDDWLKFKCVRDQEFVVGGFTEPRGSRTGFGALLVGYYEGDRLRYAGKVGTGYTDAVLRELRGRLEASRVERCPFADRVREPDSHWVRPELVVAVGFSEWTTDGKLRHPRFTGLREDKAPADVVREQ